MFPKLDVAMATNESLPDDSRPGREDELYEAETLVWEQAEESRRGTTDSLVQRLRDRLRSWWHRLTRVRR